MKNHTTSLKAGDKAPDFKAKDQNGKIVSLKEFAGKKLVLYFYPKDNTPTCTVEACNLRDNYSTSERSGKGKSNFSMNFKCFFSSSALTPNMVYPFFFNAE